jgi:hypothetical protein
MKRFLFILSFLLIPIHPVIANTTITITEPATRNAQGIFINDDLASSITPEGRLGKLLFERTSAVRSYVIDMGTIAEIQDLADGYSFLDEAGEVIEIPEFVIADIWLNTLRSAVKGRSVTALPYGNPDREFLERRSPGEYQFLKKIGAERLQAFLELEVASGDSLDFGGESTSKARSLSSTYRRDLRVLYSVAPAPELASLRLQLGQLLNPALSKDSSASLYESLALALEENQRKLRVARGNYTITASNYDLPVTVINDYSVPITVELIARPTNSRIVLGSVPTISVAANSQSQVEVPLRVNASGETQIEMKLRNAKGRQVAEIEYIPLRLAVISPLTTWFTTGMAIILLLAAVVQSMRRVKKRKKQ